MTRCVCSLPSETSDAVRVANAVRANSIRFGLLGKSVEFGISVYISKDTRHVFDDFVRKNSHDVNR